MFAIEPNLRVSYHCLLLKEVAEVIYNIVVGRDIFYHYAILPHLIFAQLILLDEWLL